MRKLPKKKKKKKTFAYRSTAYDADVKRLKPSIWQKETVKLMKVMAK